MRDFMTHELEQRIEKLCELITEEQDRQKLLKLAEEVNILLEQKRFDQKPARAA
jgi:hypothetical protein